MTLFTNRTVHDTVSLVVLLFTILFTGRLVLFMTLFTWRYEVTVFTYTVLFIYTVLFTCTVLFIRPVCFFKCSFLDLFNLKFYA